MVAQGQQQFLILVHDASGSYVQAAGAYDELVAEWREVRADGFTHAKLCLPGRSEERRPPVVPGYEGYLDKEVLSVERVVEIFQGFAAAQCPPALFERLDFDALSRGREEGDELRTADTQPPAKPWWQFW
jgi:hypothetical protein